MVRRPSAVRTACWRLLTPTFAPTLPISFAHSLHTPLNCIRPNTDGKSSRDALNEALDNLENLTLAVLAAYEESLASGDYETVEDLDYSFEAVNDRLWAEKEASGRGSREDFEREKREKKEEEDREQDKLAKAGKKGKAIKVAKKE